MKSVHLAIKRMMKENIVAKIRNNMYICISGETRASVEDCFQLASHITKIFGIEKVVKNIENIQPMKKKSISVSRVFSKPIFISKNRIFTV